MSSVKEGLGVADEIRDEMRASGYLPAAEAGLGPRRETEEIDSGVAASVRCPNCGFHGMGYEAWIHPERYGSGHGGYRALALCPNCPHGQEF